MDPPAVKSSTERAFQRNTRLTIEEVKSEKITYAVMADASETGK